MCSSRVTHHAIGTWDFAVHSNMAVRVYPSSRSRSCAHPSSPHWPTPIHPIHTVHAVSSSEVVVAIHGHLLLGERVAVQLHAVETLHDLVDIVGTTVAHVSSWSYHNSRTGRTNFRWIKRSVGHDADVVTGMIGGCDLIDQGDWVGISTLSLVRSLSLDELERGSSSERLRWSTAVTRIDVAHAAPM